MRTNAKTTAADRPDQSRQNDLHVMLQDRQRELQNVLRRRVRGGESETPNDGLDETEHAEADIQEHIEVALIQMKVETLQRLREALVRLEAGEYGDCTECGDEISEKRLRALPFAIRCRDCEELHEQHAARERRLDSPQNFALVFTQPARS